MNEFIISFQIQNLSKWIKMFSEQNQRSDSMKRSILLSWKMKMHEIVDSVFVTPFKHKCIHNHRMVVQINNLKWIKSFRLHNFVKTQRLKTFRMKFSPKIKFLSSFFSCFVWVLFGVRNQIEWNGCMYICCYFVQITFMNVR